MSTWQALQPRQHLNAGWRRPADFRHAKEDALAPLVISELGQAIAHYVVAFSRQPSGEYELVAVLSLQSGVNIYMDADGRWQAPYVPAFYRSYPFNLLPNKQGDLVVCIDQDSGLFHQQAQADDKPLFTADGEPSESLQEAIDFMQQRSKQQMLTRKLANELAAQDVIAHWELQLKTGPDTEDVRTVKGLYRIDESRLKGLDPDVLSTFVKSGSLATAYAQLLSQARLPRLQDLYQERRKQMSAADKKVDIAQLFGEDDILIKFD